MFKLIATILLLASVALASAKPGLITPALLTAHHHSAALVSAPLVVARSSQVIARNYNGLVPVSAPLVHHHQPYVTHPVFTSDARTYSSYTTYPHFAPAAAYHPAASVLVAGGAPLKYVAAAGPVHF